jgi:DNA-binding NtrC family response regulator
MITADPVLLVKSDIRSRMMQANLLSTAGFSIIEVESTDLALSYLESRSDIRIVIADLDMPGCLSGLDLAWFVIRQWPHIPIIIIGWPPHPTPSLPQIGFVPEPCPPSWLLQEVRGKLALPPQTE